MSTYTLKREIPIEDEFDLVVAGGGPAGTAAAVCAARLGAKVLLLEATGCLGGMGTSGLVTTFGPVSDGKQMLVGGLMKQIVLALQQRGQLGPHVVPEYLHSQLNRWVPFKPEGLKRLLDELVQDAGVDVRFFTRVIDAEVKDTKIDGVVISNVEGYRYIRAKTYIDATGDAALSDLCGAECKVILRDIDAVAPSTLCSLYSGVNWDDPAYGEDWRGIDAAKALSKKLLLKAIDDEHFTQPDRFMPGMNKIGKQAAQLNGGHVFNLNGLDVRSLSDGMIFGRKLAVEYESFFRKYMPGCENIELLTTAPVMGVRDTRRIVGEFELLFEDYTSGRQFPDQIAVYNRPTDVHPTDTSEKEFKRFTQDFEGKHGLGVGQSLGIPYSILVPKGWTNLWVAGRCHSSDTKVHGSIRAQSAAYMMGQAAGTAAVQSIATGQPACDLDTEDLVLRLREQGANLPQATLSKTMTR
ncbi:MAG TPA: FAD-dependent oxidoreductase [Beijerinckiaceae bacterium]|jgi:ribulose 1,5-bisphosphate synthetase/thiazole synthase|nr:FAD-dependent oxidoreductase [Beijerinckiaceae bacterium]